MVPSNFVENIVILNFKYISNICLKTDYRNVWYIGKKWLMHHACQSLLDKLFFGFVHFDKLNLMDLNLKDLMSLNSLKPYKGQDMKEATNDQHLKIIFVILTGLPKNVCALPFRGHI